MAKKKKFKKSIKNFDLWDLKLVKWSVMTWTLFLITVWPWLRNLVLSVHWLIWLVLGIIFMWRPMKKYFSK
ncbi:MAG: hypothetical protein ABIH59_02150 [archaeon]